MKNKSGILLLLLSLILSSSCDFTPRIHNDIFEAQQLVNQQQYERAIEKYREILRNKPPVDISIKINYQIGDLFSIYLSRNQEALPYYQRVLKTSDDPLWMVKTGERIGEINFTYLKNYEKSAELYERFTKFTPKLENQEFYQYRYALSLFKSNSFSKSKKVFKKIVAQKGHEYAVRSLYYLGLIDFQLKKWKTAVVYFKEYESKETRKDKIVQARFLRANAYETMEKLRTAYRLYYDILGSYPNTKVIQNRLKSIYNRRVSRKR
jgi:tetratricopeptide (TPR) repeat protein